MFGRRNTQEPANTEAPAAAAPVATPAQSPAPAEPPAAAAKPEPKNNAATLLAEPDMAPKVVASKMTDLSDTKDKTYNLLMEQIDVTTSWRLPRE